ncbi:InlB B-repeat-containing protein [Candidatus Methanoplasma termitum]|uniref:InlB B-repeat-containing protein n=1 Tax=Candidatus Methanoplasma termitum TaxID=1577791 RepID=UPI0009E07E22
MVAVPFTAIQFDTQISSGSPLAEVTYDANGGSGAVPNGSVFEQGRDASQVLFDPLPTNPGYVFTGWNT